MRTNAVTFLMSLTRKKDLDLDEVGVCDWSYSVLFSMQVGGGLTSLFPHLNAYLAPTTVQARKWGVPNVVKILAKMEKNGEFLR